MAGARGKIGKRAFVLAQVPAYGVPAGVPARYPGCRQPEPPAAQTA